LRLFFASTSSEPDIEKATVCNPIQGLQQPLNVDEVRVQDTCQRDDHLPVVQTPSRISRQMLDNDSQPSLPTASAMTTRISDSEAYGSSPCSSVSTLRTDHPYVQSSTLVRHTSVSNDEPPVCEDMAASSSPRPNEGSAVSAALPWQRRILAPFTMYGELSVACTPEEFAFVRTRLQREWTFDGGFVSRFTIMFLFNFQLIRYSIKSS